MCINIYCAIIKYCLANVSVVALPLVRDPLPFTPTPAFCFFFLSLFITFKN